MYSPGVSTQRLSLVAQIETLIALSRVFSAGGENLDQTLPGLSQAYAQWLAEKEGTSTEDRELLNQLVKTQKEKAKKELVYEFNRLFVGPQFPPAPPYESVYRSGERLVMKESTLDVRRWYRSEGLSLVGPSNEPDDYIPTELEFAAYLLTCALESYLQDQPQKAADYIKKYNGFYQAHLAIWLPLFVQTLSQATREQLFITLGKIMLKTLLPIDE